MRDDARTDKEAEAKVEGPQSADSPPEPASGTVVEDTTDSTGEQWDGHTVDVTVMVSGGSGEIVVGEFAGSIQRAVVVDADNETDVEFHAEEVAVGVARVRVNGSGLVDGEVPVRLYVT